MPGYHTHDGFYMRLAAGGGAAVAEDSDIGAKASGGSFAFSAAFGGAILQNLILYGEMIGYGIPESKYNNDGMNGTSSHTLNITGFGPGVAYYFMPLNLYLSGTLVLHQISENASGNSNNGVTLTDTGVGVSLMVGKEWWVSADWGLGIAADFFLGSAKNRPDYTTPDSRWTSKGFAVMFSATYN
jgi:hypothetical protein